MESRLYREYIMVPDCYDELAARFCLTLRILELFDKLQLMNVHADYSSCEHNRMRIVVDGRHYDEHIMKWTERFNGQV